MLIFLVVHLFPVPFEEAFGLEDLIEEKLHGLPEFWVTAESCMMAEVVALSKFCTVAEVVHRRANIIQNSPGGRPHRSGSFKFQGPPGRPLKLVPEKSQPAESSQDSRCGNPTQRSTHKRGKRVLSLGRLLCGASGARPPSMSGLFWEFPFLGTESAM